MSRAKKQKAPPTQEAPQVEQVKSTENQPAERNITTTITLPVSLKEAGQDLAARNGLSFSAFMRALLQKALEEEGEQHVS